MQRLEQFGNSGKSLQKRAYGKNLCQFNFKKIEYKKTEHPPYLTPAWITKSSVLEI